MTKEEKILALLNGEVDKAVNISIPMDDGSFLTLEEMREVYRKFFEGITFKDISSYVIRNNIILKCMPKLDWSDNIHMVGSDDVWIVFNLERGSLTPPEPKIYSSKRAAEMSILRVICDGYAISE